MELIPYQEELVSVVFGLPNHDGVCYLNSLIQALLSCPAFNRYMQILAERGNPSAGAALLGSLFAGQLSLEGRGRAVMALRGLLTERLGAGGQQDIHEGMVLLLELLGQQVDMLFHIRYATSLLCRTCGAHRTEGRTQIAPPEIVLDLGEQVESKEWLEQYILRHTQTPHDYRCEHCGERNGQDGVPVQLCYHLRRLSEVIVLLFKKYRERGAREEHEKYKVYYPDTLDLPTGHCIMHYRVVARVEHYGTSGRGHYTATCLRPPRRDTIRAADVRGSVDHEIYLFDDERVYHARTLAPTSNTYMVFYHWLGD